MKTKKIFKLLGITFAIILVLLVIASVVLNSFLKSEKAKALIVKRIENAVNMPIEIKKINISVLSGAHIDGFGIKNPEGFGEGYLLKTDSIILKYNFLDLLRKKINISEIEIVKPTINLLQKSDYSWNLPALSSKQQDKPSDIQPASMGAILLIAKNVQIIDGNFSYEPMQENRKIAIHNFTIKSKVHSINSAPNMGVSLSVGEVVSPITPKIKDIKGSLKTSEGTAYLENISFNLSEGSVAIKGESTLPIGQVENSQNKQGMEYKATISIENIELEQLIAQFIPEAKNLIKGICTADIAIKGEGSNATADIKLSIPSLLVKEQIKINQINSNIHYDAPNFKINNLDMQALGGSIEGQGSGSLKDFKNPTFDVKLNINNINTGSALSILGQDPTLARGRIQGTIHATGGINNIEADGETSSPRLDIKKMGRVTDITAPFKATITKQNKKINVEPFSVKIYGGTVKGNANITLGENSEPSFSTTLNLSGLEAGDALKELAGKPFITGKTEGSIQLSGRGGNVNALKGNTNITFKDGEVITHPIQNLLAVFIPPLQKINFVAAKFSSTIKNGKVNIKEAYMENPKLLRYYGQGQIKLSNQKLSIPSHLSLRCALAEKMPLVSGAFTREKNNWCGIDFMILGTLAKPKTDLEDRLSKEAIGEVIEKIFEKDSKDKDGSEGLLENIFK